MTESSPPDLAQRQEVMLHWREQAERGGLPMPQRQRWQPLRVGVVNLWEFDRAEAWFADGRLQLAGANESGKSTLMTLTTLLLFAGDVSSHNIDTLGSSTKRFRFYIEPSEHPMDRRENTAKKYRGWAWAEYGRLTDDGPEFFTTLLYAQARVGDNDIAPTWCTLIGRYRVRAGLTLVESGYPVDPAQIKTVTGFDQHASGEKYRAAIARTMFDGDGTVLAQLIRVLRVLRTPKIGARFEVDDLATAFRHALPAIDDSEIEQLSQDWDELERMRTEKDNAEQALAAITQFTTKYWLPWAHSEIRQACDPVIATDAQLTKARTDQEREQSTLDKLATELAAADSEITTTEDKQRQAQTQSDQLKETEAYTTAASATANARSLAEQAAKADERVRRATHRVEAASARLAQVREHHDTVQRDTHQAAEELEHAGRAVGKAGREAGCGVIVEELVARQDISRLNHLTSHRQQRVDHLRGLFTRQGQAEHRAEVAHEQLRRAETQYRHTQDASTQADTEVEQAIATLAHDLSAWTSQLPDNPPPPALVETWMAQVASIVDAPAPGPVLGELLRRQHLQPAQEEITGQLARQQQQLTAAESERTRLSTEVDRLSSETEPTPPEPTLWSRRPRPTGVTNAGAPLWRLVDPAATTSPVHVAALESALDAAGLLQAWITPDGQFELSRDGHDIVWQLGSPAGNTSGSAADSSSLSPGARDTLRTVLEPAAGIPADLSRVVDRLLSSVAYTDTPIDPASPDTGVAGHDAVISSDGSWRLTSLTGRAAPASEGAQLLGTAAREQARQRRLEHLRHDLDLAQATVDTLSAAVETLTRRGAALAEAYRNAPSDTAVVTAVHAARHAAALLDTKASELQHAQDTMRDAREAAETATRDVIAFAGEHDLPRHSDGLDAVASAVASLRTAIGELNTAIGRSNSLVAALTRSQQDLQLREADLAKDAEDADTEQQESRRLHTAAEEARTALSLDGQEVLDRVAALAAAINGYSDTLRTLRDTQRGLLEQRMAAQNRVDTAAQHHRNAQTRHAEALTLWSQHLDSGLPTLCGIAVTPEPTPESAVDNATSVAHALPIDGWEPCTAQSANHTRRRWEALTAQLPVLRSQLEALSSRTANLSEPSDSNPAQQPSVDLIVDGSGRHYAPPLAVRTLQEQLDQLRANYDAEFDHAINELLGSTFVEHLRDRLVEVETLRQRINVKLKASPTTTSALTLRLVRVPVSEERDANAVLKSLEDESVSFLPAATQKTIKEFLAGRVTEAQEAAKAHGETDWRKRLELTLDYRRWFDLKLEYRTTSSGDKWIALERAQHDTFSGGARVVTLLAPFIAALQAMYDQHPSAPRLMWLDEAFDGVDPPNKTALFRLLRACDLDWMMAGPGLLANNPEVPFAAIVTTCRAPRPLPGVFFETMLWNGKTTSQITTPDPADLPELTQPLPPGIQAIALDEGLFDQPG
ncbi:hypothetical protein Lesp02_02620 [Lentzea sp. NBRC 105346]|uniref:TIGR02680 family protein n=1 Tax=Lentzea sp. NBRC 105346 TaxID=3032205 RepID=UPI0024A2EB87|nr:TIGR02680 family protein [Lentzea sp. NBRC 105346]GLZ28072.1 hypothetical protein Lesp02_02620 [Lentzea sp. NBRC 105346]